MVGEGRTADADRSETDEVSGSSSAVAFDTARQTLHDLVVFLAENLVTHPDSVKVEDSGNGDCHVFQLHVHKEDLGRIIGKQGRTAKALRTLLNATASKVSCKSILEIVED